MDFDGNIYCPRCMRRLPDTDPEVSVCPLCGRSPTVSRPPMALDAGTLLAGRYQLCDVIGQGGFGITYAAWDETLGMPVAVKEFFPRADAVRDPEGHETALAPRPARSAEVRGHMTREAGPCHGPGCTDAPDPGTRYRNQGIPGQRCA